MTATAKKMLSVFLAFVLVFTLSPTVAFGEGNVGDGANSILTETGDVAGEAGGIDASEASSEEANTDNAGKLVVNDKLLEGTAPAGNGAPATDGISSVPGDNDNDDVESQDDEDLTNNEDLRESDNLADERHPNADEQDELTSASEPEAEVFPQSTGTYQEADGKVTFTYEDCTYEADGTTYSGLTITKLRVENSGDITFPSKIDDKDVIGVGDPSTKTFVFEKPGSVANLTFPSSIKFVYGFSFTSNVSGTVKFESPSSVTTLYDEMFLQFYGPTVILPSSLAAVPARMFKGSYITSLTLPDSVRDIYLNAFTDTWKLESVTLNSGLQTIGQEAFAPTHGETGAISENNIPKFTSITIPSSVTTISEKAFFKNLTTLGSRAFAMQPITSVALPNGLISLGYDKSAYSLDSYGNLVYNGDTSEKLGAFAGCAQLASITWPQGVGFTTVGGFNDCTSLTAAAVNSLPNSVTRIDDYAFYNCTGIGAGDYRANCNVAVIDNATGRIVSQGSALRASQAPADESPIYEIMEIRAGNYTVVAWQQNDYFSRISGIGDFAAMGFSSPGDFAQATVTVEAGKTAEVTLNVPALDTSKISGVLVTGSFTIADYYAIPEVPFVATVSYDMTTGQSVDTVQVRIPEGVEPLVAATTAKEYFYAADGVGASSWDPTSRILTIGNLEAADRQSGKISLSLKATTDGIHSVSASVVSNGMTAPLGADTVNCQAIRLVVPEGTLTNSTFTAHVYAKPNSTATLKIGDTVLDATCKTNLVGHGKATITIPKEEITASQYYQVTATIPATNAGEEDLSDTAIVQYLSFLDDIPIEPTIYDFWFESAGQKVLLSEKGEALYSNEFNAFISADNARKNFKLPDANTYDYAFGVFNNSFRHTTWDPEGIVWNTLAEDKQKELVEFEDEIALAYDALAIAMGNSQPMYEYESFDAYLEAEYGISDGDENPSQLAGDGYAVFYDKAGNIQWPGATNEIKLENGQMIYPDPQTSTSTWYAVDRSVLDGIGKLSTASADGDDEGMLTTAGTSDPKGGATGGWGAIKRFGKSLFSGNAEHGDIDTALGTSLDITGLAGDLFTDPAKYAGGKGALSVVGFFAAAKSIIDSSDSHSIIEGELTERKDELQRLNDMIKYYETHNVLNASECVQAMIEETQYLDAYIDDLVWAERITWCSNLFGGVSGGLGAVSGTSAAALGALSVSFPAVAPEASTAALFCAGISTSCAITSIMTTAATAAVGSLLLPDIGNKKSALRTMRYKRERICKDMKSSDMKGIDPFAALHYAKKTAIDPSGWTYEAVQDNRLEDVVATIYQRINGEWVKWDAAAYDQENPQSTTAAGLFAWDVPEGDWRVLFQKAGYLDKWSDIMHVLPAWVNVAINMLRADPPVGTNADANVDDLDAPYVDITFDQFMKAADGFMPTVTVDGAEVTSAYWVNVVTGTDENDAETALSRVLRVPLAGLIEPGDTVTVTVDGAYSYAGVQMTAPYTTTVTIPDNATYYYVAPDDVATFTKGSGKALDFTFKRTAYDERTFPRFQGILVDGAAVDASNYTAAAGSVVVTLKASYLEALSEGSHTLTAQFSDGSAAADFKVVAATDAAAGTDEKTDAGTDKGTGDKAAWTRGISPATGDRIAPMGALLIAAAIACGVVLFARGRSNAHKPAGKHTRR